MTSPSRGIGRTVRSSVDRRRSTEPGVINLGFLLYRHQVCMESAFRCGQHTRRGPPRGGLPISRFIGWELRCGYANWRTTPNVTPRRGWGWYPLKRATIASGRAERLYGEEEGYRGFRPLYNASTYSEPRAVLGYRAS